MTTTRARPTQARIGEPSFADRHAAPGSGQRCATIAQAAATGLMTHTDIDDAAVRIDGPRCAPRLSIECLLAPEGDVSRTTELVVGVRDQLEAMLDLTFDAAEMTIRNVTGRG